eukprot:CAMPEP_0206140716 /NCGR_PEP_ID=MMETSP1473-20131121/10420_1 /ASSEMBLY_ACC=CAM_ASM_001109 /TAXON_ID=1461547 /ORGANISM="Stichococcus sp, Strain RCC1054" /LENGTH=203 /DNA_ID=CAMNT_0053534969 /DNA_START=65 /DNA_END=673 /DNA_ORIENTATION=+
MTVTKAALIALLKASKPTFKSKVDRLAFAVHACLLTQGYRVVACGEQADSADPDEELTEEVDTDGWNDQGDHFAFRYLPENGNVKDGLQVMMDGMGESLLVYWATVTTKDPPQPLSLALADYTTDAAGLEDSYKNLDKLVNVLSGMSLGGVGEAKSGQASATAERSSGGASPSQRQCHEEEEPDVHDALRAGKYPGVTSDKVD